MRLQGKTALITGAARGIGRAFAEAYIREGARVAIADINEAGVRATAAEIGAHPVVMDVTDQSSIDAGVADAVAALGHLDILVNNAALFDLAPIVDITRDLQSTTVDAQGIDQLKEKQRLYSRSAFQLRSG